MKKILPIILILTILTALTITGCEGKHEVRHTPKVGEKAIALPNKILADGAKGEELCTLAPKTCSLHTTRMSESLKNHRPVFLQFASPIHCTICDTQLAMDMEFQRRYGKDIDFIHLDAYKEPNVVGLWGHKGDPWTFLIDRNGEIAFVMPGSSEYNELENDIKKTIAIPEKKHD